MITPDVLTGYLVAYAEDHGYTTVESISIPRRPFIKYITEILDMAADMYEINRAFSAEDLDYIHELADMFILACQHEDDFVMTRTY